MRTSLKKLLENKEFKAWHKTHDKAYLSSIFLFEENKFKIGYYNPESHKITAFDTEPFNINPEDDVVGDSKVKELHLDKVKISFTKAMQLAKAEKDNKAKNEEVKQTIAILQNLNAQLYNITFVTTAFNIVNVRIDASTGELIKSDFSNLLGSTKIL